ncbi:class I SAM-dependent methyltransferase [Pseudoruegeria sp. SHC-113]|uniref:class I SAM-dependent methyltransferase n=1 Tax=Pseudoruegeria sp. SHC-113 TaxID=2855439 RepID=UPI0021BB2552|nr:class I SAM-dependent methyltransferase [Pseudoruegeria sp. SHC-113]MCT8159118.1 methyltransferase domain-containing protein [Pseudoruegeria sp. SHC-113]
MADASQFWDALSERYSKSPIKDMPAYEATLARTRAYLGAQDKVLELGCGTASTALLLAGQVAEYTASDFSHGMVEIGRAKAAQAGVRNLRHLQAAIPDAQFADAAYDTVLAFNLLHLLPDLPASLADVHRILKPGGHFISKSVCLGGAWYLKPVISAMRAVGKAPYVAFLTPEEVEAAISAAGFEIIERGDYPKKRTPSRFVVARKL